MKNKPPVKANREQRTFLIVGSDGGERNRRIAALETAWAGKIGQACDRITLDLQDAPLQFISEAIETTPLFAGPRLVWLQHFDAAPAEVLEYLARRLPSAVEQTVVVVTAEKLDRRRKPVQQLEKKAHVWHVDPPQGKEVLTWIRDQARSLGLTLDREAVELLHAAAGENAMALRTELEKLALYRGADARHPGADAQSLTGEQLNRLLSRSLPWAAEMAIFQFVDAVAENRHAQALHVLKQLRAVGRPALLILHMLGRQYRMLVASCASPRPRAEDVARELGVPPFAARKALRQAQRMQLSEAIAGMDAILEADYRIKTGWDDALVLEMLVAELTLGPGPAGNRTPKGGSQAGGP